MSTLIEVNNCILLDGVDVGLPKQRVCCFVNSLDPDQLASEEAS